MNPMPTAPASNTCASPRTRRGRLPTPAPPGTMLREASYCSESNVLRCPDEMPATCIRCLVSNNTYSTPPARVGPHLAPQARTTSPKIPTGQQPEHDCDSHPQQYAYPRLLKPGLQSHPREERNRCGRKHIAKDAQCRNVHQALHNADKFRNKSNVKRIPVSKQCPPHRPFTW